jgi:hypothetical protein
MQNGNAELIDIDGEQWEIREEDTIWIGHGVRPGRNFGCIVSAHNRDALIKGIPGAREKHRMTSVALGMEKAIITAFHDCITSNRLDGYKNADDYEARQAKLLRLEALCKELWPWCFPEGK